MDDDFSDSELDAESSPLDEMFAKATQQVTRTHDKHSPTDLLELYGLYKQATSGKCNTSKPNIFNMQARSKWCAWNDLGEMPQDTAKQLYVETLQKLDPAWSATCEQDNASHGNMSWVVHSIEVAPTDLRPEHEKTIFDFVKERNLAKVRDSLQASHIQELDDQGMGLIHWATDRNALDILQFLLESGMDVNMRDADQQTALHYAITCAHPDCVLLLRRFNADVQARDVEGQSCWDVADTEEMRNLLN